MGSTSQRVARSVVNRMTSLRRLSACPKWDGLACKGFVALLLHPIADPAYRHGPNDTQNGYSERCNSRLALPLGAGVNRKPIESGIA